MKPILHFKIYLIIIFLLVACLTLFEEPVSLFLLGFILLAACLSVFFPNELWESCGSVAEN